MTTDEDKIRADEAERCALLVTMRADISRESAAKLRREGTYTGWFGSSRVAPKWEKAAQDLELVAHAFDVVADCIRKGYDPRDLKKTRKPDTEPGVDPWAS
jgi:hypothetical protein